MNALQRALGKKGRPMTLHRPDVTDVTVTGFLVMYRPDQIGRAGIQEGDARVTILNDEIAAATWPGPPRARDQIVIDNRTWLIRESTPEYLGETCIGYSLFCRGG